MAKKNSKTPRLFHGTSELVAKSSCSKAGLVPYEVGTLDNGSPRGICASSVTGICLTTTYPGLMAFNSTQGKERWGVIEIDAAQLHPEAFLPHEGFLLEKTKGKLTSEDDRLKKLSHLRQNLGAHRRKWRESLDEYGFCTYEAAIPLQAILRVTVYDPLSNWTMTRAIVNVNLGSKYHQSNLHRHEMTTRWVNGDLVTAEEWMGPPFVKMTHSEKDKITQVLQNKFGLDIFYSGSTNGKKVTSWW